MTAKTAFTKLLTFAVIGTLPLFAAAKSPVFAAAPIGYFDGLHNDNCYIDGWTLDPDEPNTSIQVHVYRDGPAGSGTLVAAFTADVPRSDVNEVTGYPGNHAFAVNLDSSTGFRDGQPHQIFVYGINTDGSHINSHLGNSPKTAQCSVVTPTPSPSPAPVPSPAPTPPPTGGGGSQNQGQDQSQSQSGQQTTTVNVSNTNTNTNTINLTAAAKEKEKAKAKAPAKQPETGLSMGATLAMLSGAPLGLWLRRFGKGVAIVDTSSESMGEVGMSLVSQRASKFG